MQLPAGTLGPGEDVYAGARREAFEETGLDELLFRFEVAVVAASRSGAAIVNRAMNVGGRVFRLDTLSGFWSTTACKRG
jgi:8-oxo-dGTP pyrophosphatase MutT (NUDIX family)